MNTNFNDIDIIIFMKTEHINMIPQRLQKMIRDLDEFQKLIKIYEMYLQNYNKKNDMCKLLVNKWIPLYRLTIEEFMNKNERPNMDIYNYTYHAEAIVTLLKHSI